LPRQFKTVEEMVRALRTKGIQQVTLSAKVATTTSPGGEQIAFRGRIVVEAKPPRGGRLEYVEQVMPYIANTKSPDIAMTEERSADLRAAQLTLARQLRSYRGEYQGVVASARAQLIERLQRDGIAVVEPED